MEAEFPVADSEPGPTHQIVKKDVSENLGQFVGELKNALLCSFIVTYAQGMSMMQTASKESGYGLDLSDIAKIWRGGCIIRSALLEEMRRAFAENPELPNLMLDDKFAEILSANRGDWRTVAAKFSSRADPRSFAFCIARVFRCVSVRTSSGKPDPGPTRFLWRPHLSANRQRRNIPHA